MDDSNIGDFEFVDESLFRVGLACDGALTRKFLDRVQGSLGNSL